VEVQQANASPTEGTVFPWPVDRDMIAEERKTTHHETGSKGNQGLLNPWCRARPILMGPQRARALKYRKKRMNQSSARPTPVMTDMIRLDLLQAGDVLLVSGRDLASRGIVVTTNKFRRSRRYSHAALVLGRCLWLETDRHGAGITHVRLKKIEQDGARLRLFADHAPYRRVAAFRHPELAQLSAALQHEYSELLTYAAYQFCGLPYSSLDRLGEASDWLSWAPMLKRRMMGLLRQQRSILAEVGPFCSELVALMHEGFLRKRLMRTITKEPFQLSPNDFADSRLCRLRSIPGVVTSVDAGVPDVRVLGWDKYRSDNWVAEGERNKQVLFQLRKYPNVPAATAYLAQQAAERLRALNTTE